MQEIGRKYRTAVYGGMFARWVFSDKSGAIFKLRNGAVYAH
jgi:hypothetical protein